MRNDKRLAVKHRALVISQDGKCALCLHAPGKTKTGTQHTLRPDYMKTEEGKRLLRGMLCWRCMLVVQHLQGSWKRAKKAMRYLKQMEIEVTERTEVTINELYSEAEAALEAERK
jgi:hypothetical protein